MRDCAVSYRIDPGYDAFSQLARNMIKHDVIPLSLGIETSLQR